MELLYLCIYSSTMEIREFHFSHSHRFSAAIEEDIIKISEVKSNNCTEYNFFKHTSGDFITNLTAIIGKNGSGKTSLIKELCFIWKNHVRTSKQSIGDLKYVAIFEQKGKKYIIKSSHTIVCFEAEELPVEKAPFLARIDNAYNPCEYFHDVNVIEHGYDGSLMNMIARDHKNFVENLRGQGVNVDANDAYKTEETRRQLDFISDFSAKLPFDIKSVYVSSVPISYSQSRILLDFDKATDSTNEFYDQFASVQKSINEIQVRHFNSASVRFVLSVFFFSIANFIALKRTIRAEQKNKMLKIISGFSVITEKKEMTIKACKDIYHLWLNNISELDLEINEKQDAFDKVWDFLLVKNIKTFRTFDNRFCIDSTDMLPIKEFYKNYRITTFGLTDYLQFSWGISSGELAYIALFSRIYAIKSYLKIKFQNGYSRLPYNDYLFLLDEVDMCLHPEWQREYIQNLTNFLSSVLQDESWRNEQSKPRVQIIVATHSPIILSDIPRQHVLLIDGGKAVVPRDETFAANIFNLYNNNYIFQKGIFGTIMGRYSEKILSDITNLMCLMEECLFLQNQINISMHNHKGKWSEELHTQTLCYNYRLKEIEKTLRECLMLRKRSQSEEKSITFLGIDEDSELNVQHVKITLEKNKIVLHKILDQYTEDFSNIFNLVGEALLTNMFKRKIKRLQSMVEK